MVIVGGGIGGLAAALALSRLGIRTKVLEQSAEIGEIGAGVQLAPNAFAALDALGVGENARRRAVFTDRLRGAISEFFPYVAGVGDLFGARLKDA